MGPRCPPLLGQQGDFSPAALPLRGQPSVHAPSESLRGPGEGRPNAASTDLSCRLWREEEEGAAREAAVSQHCGSGHVLSLKLQAFRGLVWTKKSVSSVNTSPPSEEQASCVV